MNFSALGYLVCRVSTLKVLGGGKKTQMKYVRVLKKVIEKLRSRGHALKNNTLIQRNEGAGLVTPCGGDQIKTQNAGARGRARNNKCPCS